MGRGGARGQVRGGMIGQVRHPSPVMQPIRRGRGAMNKVQNVQLFIILDMRQFSTYYPC